MRSDEAQKGGAHRHQQENRIGRKGDGGCGDKKLGARLGERAAAGGGTDEAEDGEGGDAADGAEKACKKSAAQKAALYCAGDEAVLGADEMENLDDAAVGVENRSGREDDKSGGGEGDQGEDRQAQMTQGRGG